MDIPVSNAILFEVCMLLIYMVSAIELCLLWEECHITVLYFADVRVRTLGLG